MKTIILVLSLFALQTLSENVTSIKTSLVSLVYTQQECSVDGVIGCSNDCRSQIYCNLGQPVVLNCKSQTGKSYCDPRTSQCTSSMTSCDIIDEPYFRCPSVGYFPYALNCSKAWHCPAKPPVRVITCENNMVFDPLYKKCVKGLNCYTFSPVNGLCRGKNGSMVAHPLNKAIYAYCSGNFPQVNECPKNHIFNTLNPGCEFKCPAEGLFSDPYNADCRYMCSKHFSQLVMSKICCDPGERFNDDIVACEQLYT